MKKRKIILLGALIALAIALTSIFAVTASADTAPISDEVCTVTGEAHVPSVVTDCTKIGGLL